MLWSRRISFFLPLQAFFFLFPLSKEPRPETSLKLVCHPCSPQMTNTGRPASNLLFPPQHATIKEILNFGPRTSKFDRKLVFCSLCFKTILSKDIHMNCKRAKCLPCRAIHNSSDNGVCDFKSSKKMKQNVRSKKSDYARQKKKKTKAELNLSDNTKCYSLPWLLPQCYSSTGVN